MKKSKKSLPSGCYAPILPIADMRRRGRNKDVISPTFGLAADDCDVSLIKAQMSQQFVHGLGFCGSAKDAIIDPAEIVGGTTPSEIARTVRDEHRKVLKASMKK